MSQNLLLMTATITPPAGVPNLSRTDPAQRLEDYAQALVWYLDGAGTCFDRIVFAENSLSDVSRLREIAESRFPGKVEFVSFQGLDHPPHFDRAYGEFRLLDWAMSNSVAISQAPTDAVVWKVTGRYQVKNLPELVASSPSGFELYANFRNHPKRWVDTYLLAWTKEGYEALVRDVYHRLKTNVPGVPTGLSGEELFRSWLDQPLFRKRKIQKRFRRTPEIEGIRGADGRSYSSDDGWKIRFRKFALRFLPFLWI
ncbi:MAG TPA: hypothetical protein PKO15_16495 [Fibrobacteria bacterium]|nr:hypothetical protein [Fibrobacteria bacterium]